jgi:hypothetical protein
MASIKKLISLPENKIICMDYNQKNKLVTLGGDYKLLEKIWRLYIVCFEECDGEPQFYEVTRSKIRLQFKASFKRYQESLSHIIDEEFKLTEVDSFDRLM